MSNTPAKTQLRQAMGAALSARPDDWRIAQSRRLCDQLACDPRCQRARTILGYLAMPREINLDELLAGWIHDGKKVAAPRVDWNAGSMTSVRLADLDDSVEIRGHNVREPVDSEAIDLEKFDLTLIPGVAFDQRARRLGRGGGFYDRFLADLRRVSNAWILGVAFDEQIVSNVPMEDHDVALDAIVTPTRWIRPDSAATID